MIFNELNPEEFDSTFNLLSDTKLDSSDLNQANIRLFTMTGNDQLVGFCRI